MAWLKLFISFSILGDRMFLVDLYLFSESIVFFHLPNILHAPFGRCNLSIYLSSYFPG